MKRKEALILSLLYLLSYIYAVKIAPWLALNSSSSLNNLHESCIVKSKERTFFRYGRGAKYYIDGMNEEKNNMLERCILTWWGLSHFILYFIIGYLFPRLFWETFIIGVIFEIYEALEYNCEDLSDVVWNTCGFILGALVRTKLTRRETS